MNSTVLGYGQTSDGITTYINASTCTSNYQAVQKPIVFDYELPPGVLKSHFPEHINMELETDVKHTGSNEEGSHTTGAKDTDSDSVSVSKDSQGIDVICISFLKKHFEDGDSINQSMDNDEDDLSDSKTSIDPGASGSSEPIKDTKSAAESKEGKKKKVEFELPFELPDSLCAPKQDAEPVDANDTEDMEVCPLRVFIQF